MTRDKAYEYFITKDNNCAESVLRCINDEYHLGLQDEEIKLVSAFGAGMGCEGTCGAMCGGLAAWGKMKVEGRAHATEGFPDSCGEYVKLFQDELGSIECRELKPVYRNNEVRCLKAVELACDVFDKAMKGKS